MVYVAAVFGYLTLLILVSLFRLRKAKTQDDFMVAGRSVPTFVLVSTLICSWIGSGSIIAGAGLAYRVGLSELWMSAGAWAGIAIVFFLAARVRRIADYTLPDLLERRYGPAARVLGTITVIIAYTTIVGYQFKGGGFLLNILLPDTISVELGIKLTAMFVVLFTITAGMMSIVAVDVFNGAVITIGVIISVPLLLFGIGGWDQVTLSLPPSHFTVFGDKSFIWALGIFFPTLLLLLGESNMYQKFFSAKSEKAATHAVMWWIIGTIVVETLICILAVIGSAHFTDLKEAEKIFLHVARHGGEIGLPVWAGCMLLCAAIAIITSTANSFLLTPSTNITRDIFQRFVNPNASQKTILTVNRLAIIVLGVVAYFLLTQFPSVLSMAFTAYTIIGAGLTPAILAAFLWKRVTMKGGVASIVGGMSMVVVITIVNNVYRATGGTAFLEEDYIVLPSAVVSIALLIVVSLLTKKDAEERWKPFFAAR